MSVYEKMTALADAIRSKTGGTEKLTIDQMAAEVNGLQVGGGGEEWFNDGDTHIWITLGEGRTSPMLGCSPDGTVTVDWGDGTTPDVLTGTSLTTSRYTPTHNYASAGDYVIRLTVNDGQVGLYGSDSTGGASILRFSTSNSYINSVYQATVRKVEVGNNAFLYAYGFRECRSLESLRITDNAMTTGGYIFYNCHSLKSMDIPDGTTDIGTACFYCCYGLASVVIPNSVMSIGKQAFYNCYGVAFYDFSTHTAVPTLSATNAFTGIPADCEIRVPAALYDEWKAATNWTTYASQIVAV